MIRKLFHLIFLLQFVVCKITVNNTSNSTSILKFDAPIIKTEIKDDDLIVLTKNKIFLIKNIIDFSKSSNVSEKNESYLSVPMTGKNAMTSPVTFFRINKLSDYYIQCGIVQDNRVCKFVSFYNQSINYSEKNLTDAQNILPEQSTYIKQILPIEINQRSYYLCIMSNFDDSESFFAKLKLNNSEKYFMRSEPDLKSLTYKNKKSMVNFDAKSISLYLFHYGHYSIGNYQRYAFMLKNEENNTTKLARVCLNDISFKSYTEIELVCKDENTNQMYKTATSAHFDYSDTFLKKKAGTMSYNKTLFVALNNRPLSNDSILCAFPYERITNYFERTVNECYEGNSSFSQLLKKNNYLKSECIGCPSDENHTCTTDCYQDFFINSKESLYGVFLYKLDDEIVTSLTSLVINSKDDLKTNKFILGTLSGKIYELEPDKNNSLNSIKILPPVEISKQIEPKTSMINKTVYLISGSSLIQYTVSNLLNEEIETSKKETGNNNWIIILVALIILVASVASLIHFNFSRLTQVFKKSETIQIQNIPLPAENSFKEPPKETPKYQKPTAENIYITGEDQDFIWKLTKESLLINLNCLKIDEIIGEGNFSYVVNGELNLPNSKMKVAIKIPKGLSKY